jgi:hypothetical protein
MDCGESGTILAMLIESPTYVDDMRFALDVMDEYSHLGLDSDHAAKLRSLMLEQINKAEKATKRPKFMTVAQIEDEEQMPEPL